MSKYGDSEHARRKEDFYYMVELFLEENSISELLSVIADAVEQSERKEVQE